jgi:GTP-binding protein HflX
VYVADQLFATLDPTTRRVELPGGHLILLTDTVGFIQKLPTALVAAFRATLEEISEADLLLHVIDVTHPNAQEQARSVHQTLREIDALNIPIITALNKVDRLSDPEGAIRAMDDRFPSSVGVSALKGYGLDELLAKINEHLFETYIPIDVFLSYKEGALIAILHEQGKIIYEEHVPGGIQIKGKIPGRLLAQFLAYEAKGRISSSANQT